MDLEIVSFDQEKIRYDVPANDPKFGSQSKRESVFAAPNLAGQLLVNFECPIKTPSSSTHPEVDKIYLAIDGDDERPSRTAQLRVVHSVSLVALITVAFVSTAVSGRSRTLRSLQRVRSLVTSSAKILREQTASNMSHPIPKTWFT